MTRNKSHGGPWEILPPASQLVLPVKLWQPGRIFPARLVLLFSPNGQHVAQTNSKRSAGVKPECER